MPTPTESAPGSRIWGQTPQPASAGAVPMATGVAPPAIGRGSLLILRQFDVADEANLDEARRLLLPERSPAARPRATALLLSNPPLSVSLGRRSIELGGTPHEVDVFGRVFDFGTISIRFRLTLPPDTSWHELSNLTRFAQGEESPTRVAREVVGELVERLSPALQGRHVSALFEDYVIVFVEQLAPPDWPRGLPADAVARLLLGEPETAALSAAEVEETTRHRSSYFGEDLCVTGWNVALVIEPAGDTDTVDVLELANAQLLELRYYDDLLDRELARLYDDVGQRRGRSSSVLRNYGRPLRRALMLMLEISEFIERVENALKIIGDVYLARLYAGAVETLRIPSWERAVTRKQALVQQVSDVLKSEVDVRRGQVLEIVVIVLIFGEIMLAMHAIR